MLQIDPGEVGRNMRAVRVSKNIGRGRLAEKAMSPCNPSATMNAGAASPASSTSSASAPRWASAWTSTLA